MYLNKLTNYAAFGMKDPKPNDHQQAKCLYLWVMTAIPEAKTMFKASEIADVDGDGWKCFVDGWGNPIGYLRWAHGATGWSDVQIRDDEHHDPFDPAFVQADAYHLYPLIFAGVLGKSGGINLGSVGAPTVDPYGGSYAGIGGIAANGGVPLVHNHHMDQR
jgi:hypothetical protein